MAISRKGNENNRTRIPQTLTRGGSPPNACAALSLRGAIETWQSPGRETKTIVHAYPKYLPAVAHRRTPRSEAEYYVTRNGTPRVEERRVAAKRIAFATCCLAERT